MLSRSVPHLISGSPPLPPFHGSFKSLFSMGLWLTVTCNRNHDKNNLDIQFLDELKKNVRTLTECTKTICEAVAVRYSNEC